MSKLTVDKLINKDTTNYAKVKFPSKILNDDEKYESSLTITTNGRPVFISFSGDINCYENACWLQCNLYRDENRLTEALFECRNNLQNTAISLTYLDIVDEGQHTYKMVTHAH